MGKKWAGKTKNRKFTKSDWETKNETLKLKYLRKWLKRCSTKRRKNLLKRIWIKIRRRSSNLKSIRERLKIKEI
jgi:division protein CdvB (Snf7/Vps24/ESCRT-III family)